MQRSRERAGSALGAGVTFPFRANPLWGWCGPGGFCSWDHSWEDGLAWGSWGCNLGSSSPEAALLPGTARGGLNEIYASIKDLYKLNWGPTLNCMRLRLLGPFLQTE